MDENATSYKPSWLTSKEFRFIVGKREREFTVHSELVAKQSQPLRALIANGMNESQEGLVKWPNIDPQTFQRFAEFLYSGDFHVPGFVPLENNPQYVDRRKDIGVDIANDDIIINAWARFRTRKRYLVHQIQTLYEPSLYTIGVHEVTHGFISIAKVHILAHYYDIGHLMEHCRCKLHRLMVFNPEIEDSWKLLQLCMREPGAEGLRELVFEYCALSMTWLLGEPDFQDTFKAFPEAATGIMKKMKGFTVAYSKELRRLPVRSPSPDSLEPDYWELAH